MKRILISLVVILTLFSLTNAQQNSTVIANTDTVNTAVTVIGAADADADSSNINTANAGIDTITNTLVSTTQDALEKGIIVAIISIIAVFGLPVFVLFIIFFFRYKNRKSRYHLVEQAIAAGVPIPENLINENKPSDPCATGIKNTFTGIGLFVFLWAITGEFSIGAIGLLVMFMGIGKWLIGYKQQKEQKNVSHQIIKKDIIIEETDKNSNNNNQSDIQTENPEVDSPKNNITEENNIKNNINNESAQ
ncbi:DUF6249 domain-containing protein [Bacteroides sp.]|uniref:DUF6249 domain-containing protein n=1 Tax=Bacteroides sp. TaxID=29523 RepID=UPI002618A86B|nr:DUF6249 domain-containing protein [Bacteroides sp.]MDD3038417.1 DUF6249 domain-containing protein [Bacteroides sp.]